MRICQAGRAPGPLPRRGPPSATGGHRTSICGVGYLGLRANTTDHKTKPVNILQWYTEGISTKKVPLTERLRKENIDVACIKETHLNPDRRFNIRGYETLRHDRIGRQKGGVLILVKNTLLPIQNKFIVETNQQSEIQGVQISLTNQDLTIYNLYCPQDKELQLQSLNTPAESCMVLGDFNSRSTCWGYDDTDTRGDEVEDWQIDNNMILLNMPEDTPTLYSRRWMTTSAPDLAFATADLSPKLTRTVLHPLGGSDHRPVKLSINLHFKPPESKTVPRWNYKKANWEKYMGLTDKYTKSLKEDSNIDRVNDKLNKALLKADAETTPRGARKNYKPYWTEELQALEDEVTSTRQIAEESPNEQNNISLKAATARYRGKYRQAARNS